jgi:AAA family ATP:ADP antiporter
MARIPSSLDASKANKASEARLRRGAFCTLGGVMAAHALLETGRDALFLANLPVEQLPWVYLAIAAITIPAARATATFRSRSGNRVALVTILCVASLGTLASHFLLDQSRWAFHALYIWSAVISSLAVLHFWLALGDELTITQGKRLYAPILLGGSLGAMLGFGAATALARVLPVEALLLVSSGVYALSVLGPLLTFEDGEEHGAGSATHDAAPSFRRALATMASTPYTRGVAAVMVLSTLTFTLGDFLFKSFAAANIEGDALAEWFGAIYFSLNLASLLVLAFVTTPLLRRIGLQRSLVVLPTLLAVGGLGLSLGFAFGAIALIKSAEGTLRYSLHRTASELLFLPMSHGVRTAAKSFAEVAGDKGAKALASLAILAVVGIPDAERWISLALVGVAVAWASTALALRRPYLDVFRSALSEDTIATRIELPDLDLGSLETLMRALNHQDERTVGAALVLLEERERTELIPTLILYHPSPAIVSQAIEIFTRASRRDLELHTERLLEHPAAEVRAAATRALASLFPDRAQLERLTGVDCPCIRVSAVAGLIRHGWIEPAQARFEFEEIVSDPRPDARRALARSARLHYSGIYRESLLQLAQDSAPDVRGRAVEAMRHSADDFFTAPLVELLGDREVREEVRLALLERSGAAVTALASALANLELPVQVRRHIPRALARFASAEAAQVLLDALREPTAGVVRFKVLSALRQLFENPDVHAALDTAPLAALLEETTTRSLDLLHWQAEIETAMAQVPERKTTGGELLLALLYDKERLSVERIFLLLGLLHPAEDFGEIRVGLASRQRHIQASGVELLENVVTPDLAQLLLALYDDAPSRVRLVASGSELSARSVDFDVLLTRLSADRSNAVRTLAGYYAEELERQQQHA